MRIGGRDNGEGRRGEGHGKGVAGGVVFPRWSAKAFQRLPLAAPSAVRAEGRAAAGFVNRARCMLQNEKGRGKWHTKGGWNKFGHYLAVHLNISW